MTRLKRAKNVTFIAGGCGSYGVSVSASRNRPRRGTPGSGMPLSSILLIFSVIMFSSNVAIPLTDAFTAGDKPIATSATTTTKTSVTTTATSSRRGGQIVGYSKRLICINKLRAHRFRLSRPYPDNDGNRKNNVVGDVVGPTDAASSSSQNVASTAVLRPDRPTQTLTERPGPRAAPGKPKIVVLGATGKIGRLVVRQLLDTPELDATVVAFVRDYDKACRVLYDDLISVGGNSRRKGPRLEIIRGDLVPPEELPQHQSNEELEQDEHEDEEEAAWTRRAESAARFFGTSVADYDDGVYEEDPNLALEHAMRDCTAVISCVGSVRPTNVWTDWIRPLPIWRLLRPDVSNWCRDPRHPYYVNYASTRKVLAYAEREQLRRLALIAASEDPDDDVDGSRIGQRRRRQQQEQQKHVSRIRFVRISDLCVSQAPWNLVPVLTNALHSMVFRYQAMAEAVLDSSAVVDTVVLRPGDLVDDERDSGTTSLQVDASGRLPAGPSRVGRDDVAALAVAAALFEWEEEEEEKRKRRRANGGVTSVQPFHFTLAARWAGEELHPYPSQGRQKDGLATAQNCIKSVIRELRRKRREKRLVSLEQRRVAIRGTAATATDQLGLDVLKHADNLSHRKRSLRGVKPYGICVAVPVYIFLFMFGKSLLVGFFGLQFPGRDWLSSHPAVACAVRGLTSASTLLLTRLRLLFQGEALADFLRQFLSQQRGLLPLPWGRGGKLPNHIGI